jgi:hypothetical protein
MSGISWLSAPPGRPLCQPASCCLIVTTDRAAIFAQLSLAGRESALTPA